MRSVTIHLSLAENVKDFVNIVSKYPYDIDLRSGRHVVDAKSILGIFSLDLNKPITMEVYENDCDDLLAEIKPFIVQFFPEAPVRWASSFCLKTQPSAARQRAARIPAESRCGRLFFWAPAYSPLRSCSRAASGVLSPLATAATAS